MHIFVTTRGVKHDIDRWATQLQGKVLPFQYHDGKGNAIDGMMDVLVQPVQIWSIVFPEIHKDMMLNTILRGTDGHGISPAFKKFAWALRKGLKLDPIPEYKKDKKILLFSPNADIIGLGLKKDNYFNFKTNKTIPNPTEEEKKDCFEML